MLEPKNNYGNVADYKSKQSAVWFTERGDEFHL